MKPLGEIDVEQKANTAVALVSIAKTYNSLHASIQSMIKKKNKEQISTINLFKEMVVFHHRVQDLNFMYGYKMTSGEDAKAYTHELGKPEARHFWEDASEVPRGMRTP